MKNTKRLLIIIILVLLTPFLISQNDNKVIQAYELRMDGQLELAKTTLLEILEQDSTNAMAHFEMARAIEDEKKRYHIDKAIALDNDNLMYLFYRANLEMLEAYKAMKTNNTKVVSKYLAQCKETLNSILDKKPDCKESLLFLIEIYGYLPEDMGGNLTKATAYIETLEEIDPFYAAQGKWVLESNSDSADVVGYWEDYVKRKGKHQEALVKLGKAHLLKSDIEKADSIFDDIIRQDSSQFILKLDVARAYLYKAMRGIGNQGEMLEGFRSNINLYLEGYQDKPKLIEAWCYGWLGSIAGRQGDKKLSDSYHKKAEALIPNYPRFTALPKLDNPPNDMTYTYSTYFSPF